MRLTGSRLAIALVFALLDPAQPATQRGHPQRHRPDPYQLWTTTVLVRPVLPER